MTSAAPAKDSQTQLNSVQLNIVTLVDMAKATSSGLLDGAMYMMDNSEGGRGRGTAHLETVCKQGQVLNWIIRPMDMDRRSDGTWPPMPKISNIVFLDHEAGGEEDVAEGRICRELKIYGMVDNVRSPSTPTYYYWAGMVSADLPPGMYRYRLVLELEQESSPEKVYLGTRAPHPSIRVLPMGPATAG